MLLRAWMHFALAAAQDDAREHDLYRAQMFAAESALRLGEYGVARAWLDETPAAVRGFEFKVLDAWLDESLASFSTGAAHAYALDTSPDGARVACGLANGKLELRDLASGALVWSVDAHSQSLSDVDFSPRGDKLVTASFDRTAKVFDAASGALLVTFEEHHSPLGGATFGPEGALVASCSYERATNCVIGTLHVWNANDGELVRTLEGGRAPLIGIEFAPFGQEVAAGSWDSGVFVWSTAGGEPRKFAVPEDDGLNNAVDGCALSPDGKWVAGASQDHTARVWKRESGELVATLRGHADFVAKVAFSPDGKLAATASRDATARLWSTDDWTCLATLRGHAKALTDARFTADGARLVTSSTDNTVQTWALDASWYGGVKLATSAAAYVAAFSPDDRRLASCGYDGRIQLWSTATWDLLASWQAHPQDKSCHALAWTGDGRFLVSGSWEPVVRVWDALTLEQVAAFEQPAGTQHLAVSRDGMRAATASAKQVLVWDLARNQLAHTFAGHASSVLAVEFSPDSKSCASTARDGKALVWDAATGELRCAIQARAADVAQALFTPDGKQIVVADRAGRVTLHALDGALVRELALNEHGIQHIDVSPDATRVAFAAELLGCVDLARGGIVGRLRPHRDPPYDVDFDSSGERLASCSTDRTIVIADTRPLRDRLREREAWKLLRACATERLDQALGTGQSLEQLATDVRANADGAELKQALLDEITRHAGASKP